MSFKKLLIFTLFLGLSFSALAQNQLKNPGFEEDNSGWNFWGGVLDFPGKSGGACMLVRTDVAKWTGADQIIMLSKDIKKVEVSGWMKTESIVKGANPWEMARIALEFSDEGGGLVGGYPPVTGQKEGTSDWSYYKKIYEVPSGAASVKVQAVIGNATGAAWFDDLSVVLLKENGDFGEAQAHTGPIDAGDWYPIPVNPARTGSNYVDWSALLDAPAGKHGFVRVKEGKLQFEDGTKAKFWGVNLVAGNCFPDKSTADSLALRLSKMGANLVRLHHMDAPWATPNIFGNSVGSRALSETSLAKLDYLIFALKEKGIYVFMDLLVHREFSSYDGVKNAPPELGGKQVAYFDPKLIELQKEYAKELLSHINPYTTKAYKDEPCVVASEFINESSAFLHFSGDIATGYYRKELEDKFADQYPGKKLAVFDLDYSAGVTARVKERVGTQGDIKESILFFTGIEKDYYATMYSYLKKNLGVKYLLAGTNFPIPVLACQKDNTALDFSIANDYWDHPQLWKTNNDWSKILYAPINNTSMIRNPNKTIISNITRYKWDGKPLVVTEYNFCYPNEYRLEGPPFVAAYAALQGIDGMLEFDFDTYAPGNMHLNSFSLSRHPDQLAQWVVAAPMFLRGAIKEAPGIVYDPVQEKDITGLPLYDDYLEKHFYLPYITKVAKVYETEKPDNLKQYQPFFNKSEKKIKSETGELVLDAKNGIFTVNTSTIQGAEGNLSDTLLQFPFFSVQTDNPWLSVMAVSIDGQALGQGKSFYLVVTTPIKMNGQKFNDSRLGLVSIGDFPILAQVVKGYVKLNIDSKQIKVFPITITGEREDPFIINRENDVLKFNLEKGRSFVYEVTIQ